MNGQNTSSRRLRVFLCHSSGDKPKVRDLYRRLQQDGFAPWLDEEDLIPGQDWQLEIPKAVHGCEVVVVCLSKSSVTREGYVQREIKIALDVADEKPADTIFIIPARLEDVGAPERLKRWHWVNLFEEGGHQKLLRALTLRARSLGIGETSEKDTNAPRIKQQVQRSRSNPPSPTISLSQTRTIEALPASSAASKTDVMKIGLRRGFIAIGWTALVGVLILAAALALKHDPGPVLGQTGKGPVGQTADPRSMGSPDETLRGGRLESPAPTRSKSSEVAPTAATLEVQCDLSCNWKLDGKLQGSIAAEGHTTKTMTAGNYVIVATTADNLVTADPQSINLAPGQMKPVSFDLRAKRQEEIQVLLVRGKELFEKYDHDGAIAAYEKVLKLDPANLTAQEGRVRAQGECKALGKCSTKNP